MQKAGFLTMRLILCQILQVAGCSYGCISSLLFLLFGYFIFHVWDEAIFIILAMTKPFNMIFLTQPEVIKLFSFTPQLSIKFFLLINVKIPTIVGIITFEPRLDKTIFFAYAKTKTQISFGVTAKLISAFVFAIRIVQSLYYLYPKFQASSHLL